VKSERRDNIIYTSDSSFALEFKIDLQLVKFAVLGCWFSFSLMKPKYSSRHPKIINKEQHKLLFYILRECTCEDKSLLITFKSTCEVLEFRGHGVMKFIASPYRENKQAYENADGETHCDC
jgi:hypothetical protein